MNEKEPGKLLDGKDKFGNKKVKPKIENTPDSGIKEMAFGLTTQAKEIRLDMAFRIEASLKNIIPAYLKQKGITHIQFLPEGIVTAARDRWRGLTSNQLLAAAKNGTWSDDPIAYLELARALRRSATDDPADSPD